MAKTKNDKTVFEKMQEQFNNKELEGITEALSSVLPKMGQFQKDMEKILADQKAIESKNIKFVGVDCVALLFKDGVKVVVSNESQAQKAYDKIGTMDETFTFINGKLFDTERSLTHLTGASRNNEAKLMRQIETLSQRKIGIFDWWKQLFTGKW